MKFGLETYKLISAFPVRGNDKIPSPKGENITKLKRVQYFLVRLSFRYTAVSSRRK